MGNWLSTKAAGDEKKDLGKKVMFAGGVFLASGGMGQAFAFREESKCRTL